jgi:hypothetical protein
METRVKGHNSQGNNINFDKEISGWIQCFATSDWMFLSYLTDGYYDINDDVGIARFLTTLLTGGEDVGAEPRPIPKNHDEMFLWSKNFDMIKKYLLIAGCNKKIEYSGDNGFSFDQIYGILKSRPMIIGTYKIGGLPGGHIIVADHIDPNGDIVVKDPAGDARMNYKAGSGDGAVYPLQMCKDHFGQNGKIHSIYEV